MTNLSFLSFLLFFLFSTFSLFLLMTDSLLSASVESNFFFVCRSCCRCYTKRLHSLYYRRRSCRSAMENSAERKRKKEKKTKSHRPIIPLHIDVSLLTASFLFFLLSLSFSVLPAGGNLTKLCANSENLALVGPFATNVSSNEARVGCPIPTS